MDHGSLLKVIRKNNEISRAEISEPINFGLEPPSIKMSTRNFGISRIQVVLRVGRTSKASFGAVVSGSSRSSVEVVRVSLLSRRVSFAWLITVVNCDDEIPLFVQHRLPLTFAQGILRIAARRV